MEPRHDCSACGERAESQTALWNLPSLTAPGVLSPASLSLDSSLTVESASEGETLQTPNKRKHEEQKAKGGAGHAHSDAEVRLPGQTGRNW